MSYIVPDGYIPIAEEIDSVGREFFSDAWTGTERQTRPLLPPDEQKRILEMQPFKGSGAPGSPPGPANTSFYRKERPLPPPDSSEYKGAVGLSPLLTAQNTKKSLTPINDGTVCYSRLAVDWRVGCDRRASLTHLMENYIELGALCGAVMTRDRFLSKEGRGSLIATVKASCSPCQNLPVSAPRRESEHNLRSATKVV